MTNLSSVDYMPGTGHKEKQDPKSGLVEEEEQRTHMHILYNPSDLWSLRPLCY